MTNAPMMKAELAERTIRFLSIDAVERAKSGHPGAPMSLATIAVELFAHHLRHNPADPAWPNRDRFVLSCGHASMLLYSVLYLAGYPLSLDDLKEFRQWGSKTAGHPEFGQVPGIETTTGPLGQGFGNAVGLALASKLAGARLASDDRPLIDYRVFTLVSDGDVMEGVCHEAASLAGHWGLENLIAVYDDNRITIDGSTDLAFSEDVGRRFEALGWDVQHIDGHDREQAHAALVRATRPGLTSPQMIVARTIIARGAPTKQGTSKAHGEALGADEVKRTKELAGWPLEPFFVPEGAGRIFDERVRELAPEYANWQARVAELDPKTAALYQTLLDEKVPHDLFDELLAAAQPKKEATRVLASMVEQRAAALIPSLIGGSADLASSTKTTIEGGGNVKRGEFSGRNLHFGIREHGMAAILNGLSLSGFFIPFGSTFLIFSDYLRPSLRLGALMKRQVIYAFTHDSVFLGEDGPTHQPIEQLWSLRLIPGVHVVRPADALECAAAWTYALQRRDGPTVLSLTRQKLPVLSRDPDFEPRSALDGAYVLSDCEDPELTLIASGSEVHSALEAKPLLEQEGLRVRVVSAPCWQAFQLQPKPRIEALLGKNSRCVSIEAGASFPWQGVIGPSGIRLGIERFGTSAPSERIAEEFGFTGRGIADSILSQLGGSPRAR